MRSSPQQQHSDACYLAVKMQSDHRCVASGSKGGNCAARTNGNGVHRTTLKSQGGGRKSRS
eukprot:1137214-Pyramimonas_sp.AAC.1